MQRKMFQLLIILVFVVLMAVVVSGDYKYLGDGGITESLLNMTRNATGVYHIGGNLSSKAGFHYSNTSTLDWKNFTLTGLQEYGRLGKEITNYTFDWNDSLILYLDMDNNTKDKSGYGNDGVSFGVNCSTNVNGQINTSCDFEDSQITYINITNKANFDFNWSTPFTFSFWINFESFINDGAIYSKGFASTFPYIAIDTYDGNGEPNGLRLLLRPDVNNYILVNVDNAFLVNQWYHAIVRYNGNGELGGISFIIDGVNTTFGSESKGSIKKSLLNNKYPRIGARNTANTYNVDGRLDEYMVWNRSLSAPFDNCSISPNNEVCSLYLAQKDGIQAKYNISINDDEVNCRPTNKSEVCDISSVADSTSININTSLSILTNSSAINKNLLLFTNFTIGYDLSGAPDTTAPTFDEYAQNISTTDNIQIETDWNASDNIAIDRFFINYTTLWNITWDGILRNISAISVGTWYINISVNDTSNNINSTIMNITITENHILSFNFSILNYGIEWIKLNISFGVNEIGVSIDNITWQNFGDAEGEINTTKGEAKINYLDLDTLYYFRAKNSTTNYGYTSVRTLSTGTLDSPFGYNDAISPFGYNDIIIMIDDSP